MYTITRAIRRFFAHHALLLLTVALLTSGVGLMAYEPASASQLAASAPVAELLYAEPKSATATNEKLDTEPFIRTELYFGSERPNKPEVSDAEFKQFLDEQVTPRFPDGLTVLKGFGQFREESGEIVQETSFVLILLYPNETRRSSSAKIEEIRALYNERFEQESVLRVDDPRPVRVAF